MPGEMSFEAARSVAIPAEDGTQLALEVMGDGEPLLLVHGAAADARQWSRAAPLLAAHFTVVAMNRRNRRGSGPFPTSYDLEAEIRDLVAVASSLGSPVHLVGHSSGARYALLAAGRIPELASLVLYEPPMPEEPSTDQLERIDRCVAAEDREGVLRCFFVDVLQMDNRDFAALQQRPVWPYMVDNALTLGPELRAARSYRFTPSSFGDLAVPTLLMVGGESDPYARQVNDRLRRVLPSARLAVLPGQGHGAMIAAPELFATTIVDFISSLRDS